MTLIRGISGVASLSLCAALAAARPPAGSAFTYQGRLTENGQPADGPYDFHFHLYDSAAGGTAVTPLGVFVNDLQVADGVFTVTLDFGAPALDGDARWLNVQVRPGATSGLYTALTPRQPLTAAPYAVRALNEHWKAEGLGITNAKPGFVGVNRSTFINSAESFGVRAPVQTGFGGMYISTDGATAKPFYGYTTGPTTAWTYLDGATGNWVLNNGGAHLTVTDTGNVGVGTTAPTGRLQVVSPSQTAGLFEVTGSSLYPAVSGITNGLGTSISGRNNGTGRAGSFLINNSSNSVPALEGVTDGSGSAVHAKKLTNTSGAALSAEAAAPTAVALNIVEGTLRCQGAGVNTNTFVFRHVNTPSSNTFTVIDNPQTNGQPDAFLIVTPWWTHSQGVTDNHPPVCVYYNPNYDKWMLLSRDNSAFNQAWKWNIMVVKP